MMNEHNLLENDDAPWLDCMDGFMTHEEMLEEAERREAANKKTTESLGVEPTDYSIEAFPHVTRVEVISNDGREFVRYGCSNVQVSIQDDERTLKVFLYTMFQQKEND
jgi:hypothetical protein